MAIEIRGVCGCLGDAVIDRLISWDVDVIVTEPRHTERNALQLKFSQSSILSTGEGYSVSFDGTPADLIIGKHIVVHDIIPSRFDGELVNPELQDWFTSLQNNLPLSTEFPIRWWVGVTDVADAIARIARAEKKVNSVEICGRREWKPEDAISEIEMLWRRTSQSILGSFDSTALQIQPVPGVIVDGNRANRPDLSPLNELLKSIDGEGWRPLTPFRSAMMVLIADLIAE